MSTPEAAIELVDYNPAWPEQFARERDALEPVLRPWLSGDIVHIGSTAVPGMPAKPVIDLMAPVHNLDGSRAAIDAVAALNYVYFPYQHDVMHWFCKPSPWVRTHHLHLVPLDSPMWRQRLAFRDVLRTDPLVFAEYAVLKRDLAERFRHDREAYTDGKSPFVARILTSVGVV